MWFYKIFKTKAFLNILYLYMASFRKKRSRKYKRRNTRNNIRRNTRRKYIKARKSSINRRSRKSLVGGVKFPSFSSFAPSFLTRRSAADAPAPNTDVDLQLTDVDLQLQDTTPAPTPAPTPDTTPAPIPGTTSALQEQSKLKVEIEKAILEMAYKNWIFNYFNRMHLSPSIEEFYRKNVLEQLQIYRDNYIKYLKFLSKAGYMSLRNEFDKLTSEEYKCIDNIRALYNEVALDWYLNRHHDQPNNANMQKKIDTINNGLDKLVIIVNTHYESIIDILKEAIARLKLEHLIDIDALISEKKLKEMYDTYLIDENRRQAEHWDD